MGIHDGHRERMRQRFKKEGFDSFESHEVLEMLLYYCIPRGNTNEIAHQLIARYKTISRVLQTSPKELQTFEGIGENAAFFLSLLNEAIRYINVEESTIDQVLYTKEDYCKYLVHLFDGMNNEAVYLLCLDAKRMVLGYHQVSEGSVVSTNLPIRKIVDIAITSHAASVILAHNHPEGACEPSGSDIDSTRAVCVMFRKLGFILADHIIVGADASAYSMRSDPMFSQMFY